MPASFSFLWTSLFQGKASGWGKLVDLRSVALAMQRQRMDQTSSGPGLISKFGVPLTLWWDVVDFNFSPDSLLFQGGSHSRRGRRAHNEARSSVQNPLVCVRHEFQCSVQNIKPRPRGRRTQSAQSATDVHSLPAGGKVLARVRPARLVLPGPTLAAGGRTNCTHEGMPRRSFCGTYPG